MRCSGSAADVRESFHQETYRCACRQAAPYLSINSELWFNTR